MNRIIAKKNQLYILKKKTMIKRSIELGISRILSDSLAMFETQNIIYCFIINYLHYIQATIVFNIFNIFNVIYLENL